MTDFEAARLKMVESQLRTNKVTDPVLLEAFLQVPREAFAPDTLRGVAHVDEDLPVAPGRFLMEPMVLGRLLQAAALAATDRVLEIGGASGYGAALMSRIVRSVVLREVDPKLAARAKALLAAHGNGRAALSEGPLEAGAPERAPYDVIVLGGAVATVPVALIEQLGDGGRLVAVVKDAPGLGKATLFLKSRGAMSHRVLFDAGTPLLPGFVPAPSFVF